MYCGTKNIGIHRVLKDFGEETALRWRTILLASGDLTLPTIPRSKST